MAALQSEEIRVDNIALAENNINLIVKAGHKDHYDNVFPVSNVIISALARPNC
jgi:hypothetical protein